jgi:hypothetical protein
MATVHFTGLVSKVGVFEGVKGGTEQGRKFYDSGIGSGQKSKGIEGLSVCGQMEGERVSNHGENCWESNHFLH